MKKISLFFISIGLLVIFVVGVCFYIKLTSVYVDSSMYLLKDKVVVIDPGHGGTDPGKVGTLLPESTLNLKVSEKIEELLTPLGAKVILTRIGEEGLYKEGATSWVKADDMRIRRSIILENEADVVISIHMNAYPDNVSRGLQIFYLENHEESKLLATSIKSHTDSIDEYAKRRELKGSDELYMLKNEAVPSVIIECGFMSHKEEEILLNDSDYQDKLASHIFAGVIEYLLK